MHRFPLRHIKIFWKCEETSGNKIHQCRTPGCRIPDGKARRVTPNVCFSSTSFQAPGTYILLPEAWRVMQGGDVDRISVLGGKSQFGATMGESPRVKIRACWSNMMSHSEGFIAEYHRYWYCLWSSVCQNMTYVNRTQEKIPSKLDWLKNTRAGPVLSNRYDVLRRRVW